MKKIISFNNFYISADGNGYMVRFRKNSPSYFSNLEMCFREVFDQTLKRNLIKNGKKTIDECLKICKETKKEIKDIWKNNKKANLLPPKV